MIPNLGQLCHHHLEGTFSDEKCLAMFLLSTGEVEGVNVNHLAGTYSAEHPTVHRKSLTTKTI